MFLLKNLISGNVFYLLNKEELVVGRKESDLLIQNDQSISRKHAIIRIKGEEVTVTDLASKYKTLHNGKELVANVETSLNNNDEIQFGVFDSKYRFEIHKFVTTGTRLINVQKAQVKKNMAKIGGQYTESWHSECTHLTVQEITLTVKVLHALIDEKPIVMPSFWTDLIKNINKNEAIPDSTKYVPPMAEALLNKIELRFDIDRKSLFKGKMFVFFKEKNKISMEDIILKAGGCTVSWEKRPIPTEDIEKSPKEFLFIQTPDQEDNTSFNEAIKVLLKQGKRTIPQQEIALALLMGNCEKDCNPNFDRTAAVFKAQGTKNATQKALVPSTQSEYFTVDKDNGIEERKVIADTFDNLYDSQAPRKRERTCVEAEDDVQIIEISESPPKENSNKRDNIPWQNKTSSNENPFKKIKLEMATSNPTQQKTITTEDSQVPSSSKRKASDDVEIDEESQKKDKTNLFPSFKKPKQDICSKRKNPFSDFFKQNKPTAVTKENPFSSISQSRKNEGVSKENEEVERHKSKKVEPSKDQKKLLSSTKLDNTSPEKSFNYSKISKVGVNFTWMSKKSVSDFTGKDDTFDTDMNAFIDLFKDKIVIEILPKNYIRKTIICEDENDGGNGLSSRKNFKKFKKVKPLKPQKTIIDRDNFVAVGPGDTTSMIDYRRSVFGNSDDEMSQERQSTKKRPPKKFLIGGY